MYVGEDAVLLGHVVHVGLVHKGFEDLSGEALVRLHLLMRFVVLAALGIADAATVEIGRVEHTDRVLGPALEIALEDRRDVGQRVRGVTHQETPGRSVRGDVREVTDEALREPDSFVTNGQHVSGVDTRHAVVSGVLVSAVRWLSPVAQFDAVWEPPVRVRGDVTRERVIDFALTVALLREVVELADLSPHDSVDLPRGRGRRHDEATAREIPAGIDPPADQQTRQPGLTDLVTRLDDDVLVLDEAPCNLRLGAPRPDPEVLLGP